MNELPSEARELIARARRGQARADAAMRTRVRSALTQTLDAHTSPASTTRGVPYALKTLGLVSAVTLAGFVAQHFAARHPTDTRAAVRAFTAQPASSVAAESRSVALPEASKVTNAVSATSAAGAHSETHEHAPAARTMRATSRTVADGNDLLRETKLLRAADAALEAHDPHAALAQLHAHRTLFARGQLREEREGLTRIAKCMLEPNPSVAARYLQQTPRSLLRARILDACGHEPP